MPPKGTSNVGGGVVGQVLGTHLTQRRYVGGWKHSGPVQKKYGAKEQARAAKRTAKLAAKLAAKQEGTA